jgi:uncharacterized Tic20 family protein
MELLVEPQRGSDQLGRGSSNRSHAAALPILEWSGTMASMNALPQIQIGRAERDWAAFSHAMFGAALMIAPFLGWRALMLLAVPFSSAACLAWWDRATRPFAARHARASLNIQLSLAVAFLITLFAAITMPSLIVRILAVIGVRACYFTALALSWIGCFQASKGREASYQLYRFLR